MSLQRFTCTSKLASKFQFFPQGTTGQSFAGFGRVQNSSTRIASNTQAPRSFSATISSKPLLRIPNHSLFKVQLQAQAKRFYNGRGQKPYTFPVKPARQDTQEYQESEPQRPQRPQRLNSGTNLIGGIIVTCVSLFLWVSMEENKYRQNPNKKSRDLLQTYSNNFILSQRNINEGRYWTLITCAFSHNSITHIMFNMLAFWSFAPGIVTFYGVKTLAVVYFGSALSGSMAQLWWWNRNPSRIQRSAAGASGAIFGLTGFMAMSMPFVGVGLLFIPISIPIRTATAGMVALSVAALKEGWAPQYGHAAHLGGLVFGALWWAVALRRGRGGPKMW